METIFDIKYTKEDLGEQDFRHTLTAIFHKEDKAFKRTWTDGVGMHRRNMGKARQYKIDNVREFLRDVEGYINVR